MATPKVTITNVSGADRSTVVGILANGASGTIELATLLSDPYQLAVLETEVSGAFLQVAYEGGAPLAAADVTRLLDVASLSASVATPPYLDRLDIAVTGAMAAAGGKVKLEGRNLLQGQAFDTLTITEGGAQIVLTMLKPGVSEVTIELIKGAGGSAVTFNPGTGALVIDVGAAGDTDDNLATLVNANGAQTQGYVRAVSSSGGSFTAAQAQAPMAGGVGNYAGNIVFANGAEALPANTTGISAPQVWNDADVTVNTVAGGAATDVATAWVKSNGLQSNPLSTVLV